VKQKKIISHLPVTTNNYEAALTLIKDRFNNERKIIMSYIDAILDMPPLQSRAPEQVIKMYDTINECLQALKSSHGIPY
jgi:hypothetical protein